jgi:hypothetical protein
MAEHWRSGYHDARHTLRHPEVLERAGNGDEFTVFDFTGDGDLAVGRETSPLRHTDIRKQKFHDYGTASKVD